VVRIARRWDRAAFEQSTFAAIGRLMSRTETPFQGGRAFKQPFHREPRRVSAASLQRSRFKGNAMADSTMLDENSLKRILLGAVIGGVITALVGFSGFGWTFESTAKEMSKNSVNAAVVEALAPICADNFQHAADATKNKVALLKVSSAEQAAFITQGGWAKFPGSTTSGDSRVADACAKIVGTAK
jgi:hypothetical protein